MFNLKKGALKFLLNATIDTLPTLANLQRWKKSPNDLCKLCRCRQTTSHILSSCSTALNSGRYTWRHDTILSYILSCIDTTKVSAYSDLPGQQAAGGGTFPPDITITNLRPDVVLVDRESKQVHLFELTMPGEGWIEQRHKQKSDKYAHFATDCEPYSCTVECFEVSNKGFISTRNHATLKTLHKYTKPDIKLNTFKQNISALALYASNHIYLCRSDPHFTIPPFLPPPFSDGSSVRTRRAGQ